MTPVYKSFNDASSPLSSIVETSFSKINNYVNGKKKSRKGGGGGGGELGKAEKRALAILTRPTDSTAAAAARVTVANLQSRSIVR